MYTTLLPFTFPVRELSLKDRQLAVKNNLTEYTKFIGRYDPPEHQLEWHTALMDYSIKRLMIIAPPKYGKTPTMIDYVGWRIGNDPDNYSCLYISNTTSQAKKPSIVIRDMIDKDERYRSIYNLEIDRIKGWSNTAWYVKRKGGAAGKDPTLQACGIHGPVLGATVKEIILDDIADEENMKTEYRRDDLMDWVETTAFSRLIPNVSRVIMICTRWGDDDPVARWQKKGWVVLEMPAIACDDAWELKDDKWVLSEMGEAALTYSGYWTPEAIAQARVDLGLKKFLMMFQQEATPEAGKIFKHEYWRYYEKLPRIKMRVMSMDTAHEEKSTSAYSAWELWGIAEDCYPLIAAGRDKLDFPALKRRTIALAELHEPDAILIEKKSSGIALLQELRANTRLPIVPIEPKGDKIARANAVTPVLEAGRVMLPVNASWRPVWEHDHEVFPSGKYKDWPDCTSQFLNWARSMGYDIISSEEIDELQGMLHKQSTWRNENL